ncbi:MAG: barstar family protein [Peptostreptococcaceae bacterium]|nr:barstar family protein [Peptostreptococcaceae bacterium]
MILFLDGREIASKEHLHCRIKIQLDLPDYYGENLDALWDLLSSESDELLIRLIHREDMIRSMGEYAESFLELLEDLKAENPQITLEIS